jgi:hypothetical protein
MNWIQKILCVFIVGGGVLGVDFSVDLILQAKMNSPEFYFYLLTIFLYIASIISFFLLIGGNDFGSRFSLIFQLLQIPLVVVKPISYAFISGCSFLITWTGDINVTPRFGSEFLFGWNMDLPSEIGFNVVPVVVSALIVKEWKRERWDQD